MKNVPATHFFKRPVSVLRYVPQKILWQKAEYRALASRLPEWAQTATLTNGCVRDSQLWLRHDLLEGVEQLPTDLLLLRGTAGAEWVDLSQKAYFLSFFFNLHRKDGDIWVEVRDDYYPKFGSRARDRFDLLPVQPGDSVAIHINARYWHTLAGQSTDTHYMEDYCYLEHLGVFEQATLEVDLQQHFAFDPQKDVDLRQLLY